LDSLAVESGPHGATEGMVDDFGFRALDSFLHRL
jgi:hypothetical protein